MRVLSFLFFVAFLGCSKDIVSKKATVNSLSSHQKGNFKDWESRLIKSCHVDEILFNMSYKDLGVDLSLLAQENKAASIAYVENGIFHFYRNFQNDFPLESFYSDQANGTDLKLSTKWKKNNCDVFIKGKKVKSIKLIKSAIANVIKYKTDKLSFDLNEIRGTISQHYQLDTDSVFQTLVSNIFTNEQSSSLVEDFLSRYSISYQEFVKIFTLSRPIEKQSISYKIGTKGIWNSLSTKISMNSSDVINSILDRGKRNEKLFLILSLPDKQNLEIIYNLDADKQRRNSFGLSLSKESVKIKKKSKELFSSCIQNRLKAFFTFNKRELPEHHLILGPCLSFQSELDYDSPYLEKSFLGLINVQERLEDYVTDWNLMIKGFIKYQLKKGKSLEDIFGDYESPRLSHLSDMLTYLKRKKVNIEVFQDLVLNWFLLNFEMDISEKIEISDLDKVITFYKRVSLIYSHHEILDFFSRHQNNPQKLFTVINKLRGISKRYALSFKPVAKLFRKYHLKESQEALGSLFDQRYKEKKLVLLHKLLLGLEKQKKMISDDRVLVDKFLLYATRDSEESTLKSFDSFLISSKQFRLAWLRLFESLEANDVKTLGREVKNAQSLNENDVSILKEAFLEAKEFNNLSQVKKFVQSIFFEDYLHEELIRLKKVYQYVKNFKKKEKKVIGENYFRELYAINLLASRIVHERWSFPEIESLKIFTKYSGFKADCRHKKLESMSARLLCLSEKNISRSSKLLSSQYIELLKRILLYTSKMREDFKVNFVKSFFESDLPWKSCSPETRHKNIQKLLNVLKSSHKINWSRKIRSIITQC